MNYKGVTMAKKYSKFSDYLVESLKNPTEAKAFLEVATTSYEEDVDVKACASFKVHRQRFKVVYPLLTLTYSINFHKSSIYQRPLVHQ
jgi:hypothetical protein